MLVQSGGGKVYAIIANNSEYELGLLPTLAVHSTTVFLMVRCRFKSLQSDLFNPMLVPKAVLVGGIERSTNTLRGTVALNTGFTVEKIGTGFPQLMAEKLYSVADGFLLPHSAEQEAAALYSSDKHPDFVKDFTQLVESAVALVFPAKDFSQVPPLLTIFDLSIHMESAATKVPASPFAVHDGGKADEGPNVTKFPLGGETISGSDPQAGVDSSAQSGILKGPVEEQDDPAPVA